MIALKKIDGGNKESSKFFGEAVFPESWLTGDEFSEEEVFFCQINLKEISPLDKSGLLPKEGYLHFYFDYSSNKAAGKVRYFAEGDASTCFNEENDLTSYDIESECYLGFFETERAENGLFLRHDKLYKNEVCLLCFTPNSFEDVDFLCDVKGKVCFVIDERDLKKRAFDKAYVVELT